MIRNIAIFAILIFLSGCKKPAAVVPQQQQLDETRKMAEDALLKSGGKIPPGGILPAPKKAP